MSGAEPTWVAAEQPPAPEPSPTGRVSNPKAVLKQEEGKTLLNAHTHWLVFVDVHQMDTDACMWE